jgi:hypothetical protein
VGFNSPAFLRRGDPPVFLFHILVGVEVQSSRFQANSPTAPPRLEGIAALPRLCRTGTCGPAREGGPTSLGPGVLPRQTVTRVGPDADWGTQ